MKERTCSVKLLDGKPLPVFIITFNGPFGTVGRWPCDKDQVAELVLNWILKGERPE